MGAENIPRLKHPFYEILSKDDERADGNHGVAVFTYSREKSYHPDFVFSFENNPEVPFLISFKAETTGLDNASYADKLYFLARKFTNEDLDMNALGRELEALGFMKLPSQPPAPNPVGV